MKTKIILISIFILNFFSLVAQDSIKLQIDSAIISSFIRDRYPKEPQIIGVEYEKTDGKVYAFFKVQLPTPAMSGCGPMCYQISIIKEIDADAEHFTVFGRHSGVATDRKKIFIMGMEQGEPKGNYDAYLGSMGGFRYSALGEAKDNIPAQAQLVENSLQNNYDLFSANPATLEYFEGDNYTHWFNDGKRIYMGYNLAKYEDLETYKKQKQEVNDDEDDEDEDDEDIDEDDEEQGYFIDTRTRKPAQERYRENGYISLGTYYGRDDQYGYFEGKPIQGSDGKTFQFYGLDLSRDSRNVYFAGMILPGADPKEQYKVPHNDSFITIGETNVYYRNVKTGLDPETYVKTGFAYYKDKKKVMYRDYKDKPIFLVVKDADPKTFISLDEFYKKQEDNYIYADANDYGKDKNYIYYEGKRIENSDAATFEFLTREYARDKNNVYYEGKPMEGADPKTFHCIDDDGYRWMDKQNTFEHGKKVSRIKK